MSIEDKLSKVGWGRYPLAALERTSPPTTYIIIVHIDDTILAHVSHAQNFRMTDSLYYVKKV